MVPNEVIFLKKREGVCIDACIQVVETHEESSSYDEVLPLSNSLVSLIFFVIYVKNYGSEQ